ncbi:MAG: glycoside hydrolase [Bacteroidales bacterium]|nr:glycoside hydrolase [Bacteroidales bacterium]
MRRFIFLLIPSLVLLSCGTGSREWTTTVRPLDGEFWWGAVVNKGYIQPYVDFSAGDNYFLDDPVPEPKPGDEKPFDLGTMSVKGVTAPLLVSSKGRYVWSDRPFGFKFAGGVLHLSSKYEKLEPVVAGETLRDAYQAACAAHFPFDGREPAELMFTMPQFNNWIETVVLGINQENAEKFVDALHDSGFPCGVVMIDGGWQRYHGCRDFNPDTFPDAARLFDKIRDYGYKGVLWCSYFLSADSRPEFTSYKPGMQDILVHSRHDSADPALVWWWNGISVTMDLTRDDIRDKFTRELKDMADRFHFEGFKFDGGDPEYFRSDAVFSEPWMEPADFGHAYARVGESFPYNEYRSAFKTGGMPIVIRHYDVGHSWEEFRSVIPDLLAAGLMGNPYVFADMIGGGLSGSYMPGKSFSHKLFLRSCELQALMPMMQFSAAPWRVLTPEECEVCRNYARLHVDFGPYIMEQVHQASATGEPIMRSMEYEFPGCGYERVNQQFMLGPRYLVAPVTQEDDSKTVYLPAGTWRDDLGATFEGPQVLSLSDVPVDRLPYFELMD